ncbi:sigma-70 family RNA polymerase sigma factor [Streptomyces sp. NPDC049906]|uniref:RNA polymerase sigma factor n=1 Tax=Streptomyces sp. NPDC049906 TaxID=3155656 RepID=UPI003441C517
MDHRTPPRLSLPWETLAPLLVREVVAQAPCADDAREDLLQEVWLRLLEQWTSAGPPADPAGWLSAAVRSEVHRSHRLLERELPCGTRLPGDPQPDPEEMAVVADRGRRLRAAVRRMPVRCRKLMTALLSPYDLTYREIAGELGISQGSLGPERSRCLGCLRRMLAAEVAVPDPRGRER